MENWNKLMQGQVLITDLGEEHDCEVEGKPHTLGRYAVWSPLHGSESHSIIEIGSDLDTLREKYKIPVDRVCIAVRKASESINNN